MISVLINRKRRQEKAIITNVFHPKPWYILDFMIHLFNRLVKKIAVGLISCYQSTRFLRRPSCRFYPSCSEYTKTSIVKHGLAKGVVSGVLRIARCHPWNDGGVDEVPETFSVTNVKLSKSQKLER